MADLYITQKLVNFNTVGIPLTLIVEEAAELALNNWYGKGSSMERAYLDSELTASMDSYIADILEEYCNEQQLTDNLLDVNAFMLQIQADIIEVGMLIYYAIKPHLDHLVDVIDGNIETVVAESFDPHYPYSFNIMPQFTDVFDESNKHNLRMQRTKRSGLNPVRGHWPSLNQNKLFKPVY